MLKAEHCSGANLESAIAEVARLALLVGIENAKLQARLVEDINDAIITAMIGITADQARTLQKTHTRREQPKPGLGG